jgi:DNA uptake protein ComE-like DNA-binding protein
MHDPESASLRRAAILLLVVSLLRWGAANLGESDALRSIDVLAEHAAATQDAAAEGDRRAAPLAPGERIDPNRADEAELDRLPGIGPATARSIVSARDSGLVFRSPGDLVAVRGIGPALVDRIESSLDFSVPPPRTSPRQIASGREPRRPGGDVADLQRLPGIGPALAARIVEARRERPFGSLDDLQRVSGIGAATVARLRGVATAGPFR